jgi:hypothetical protein
MTLFIAKSDHLFGARVQFDQAQPGDVFYVAQREGFQGARSIQKWTVARVLKRDIVCMSEAGVEERFNRTRALEAYLSLEDPEIKMILAHNAWLQRKGLALRALSILELGAGAALDDEITEALAAFLVRHEARQKPGSAQKAR